MIADAKPTTRKRTRRSGRPRVGRGSAKARRKAARLAAAQALYQIDLNRTAITMRAVENVVIEFVEHRLGEAVEGEAVVAADAQLFSDITRGACHRRDRVDELLNGALDPRHPLDRLEMPLRAILRAGTYEMLTNIATHSRILIKEYIDVAEAFYGGKEPGMVNAVLDKVARLARPNEDAAGGDADGDDGEAGRDDDQDESED